MKKYDFVIVGAGTAGFSLADRLASQTSCSIALLEAGINYDNDPLIKDLKNSMDIELYDAKFFWTVGNEQQDLKNKIICGAYNETSHSPSDPMHYTGGRLFGGSSSINGGQYVKSSQEIYNKVASETGDRDWSYDSIRNVFKALETYEGLTTNPLSRGKHGPVHIKQNSESPMARKFVNSVKTLTNNDEILDYNDPNTPIGPFTRWQLTQKADGTRESSSTAFRHRLIGRVDIIDKCTVLKINFHCNVAKSVSCLVNGSPEIFAASKRIILSAGVMSPFILLRSGIGPKSDLEKAGIETIVDNPYVGKNLTNHPIVSVVGSTPLDDIGLVDPNDLYTGGALLRKDFTKSGSRDYEIIGVYSKPNTYTLLGLLLSSESKGFFKIINSDPLSNLIYNLKNLSSETDLTNARELVRLLASIIINMGSGYDVIAPSAEVLANDDLLNDYIYDTLAQTHHWVNSCRMGPRDKCGVVDSNGSVYGVKHLTIADNSIFPFPNDGNTSSTAYVVGYVIGDKLAQKYQRKCKCGHKNK